MRNEKPQGLRPRGVDNEEPKRFRLRGVDNEEPQRIRGLRDLDNAASLRSSSLSVFLVLFSTAFHLRASRKLHVKKTTSVPYKM